MIGPTGHYDVADFVFVAKRRDYDVIDFVFVAKRRDYDVTDFVIMTSLSNHVIISSSWLDVTNQ